MTHSRDAFLAELSRLIDAHVEERLQEALRLLLTRTGKPAWASGPPRSRNNGGRPSLRAQIANLLKSGPKTARELRDSLPGSPYRSINGTLQLCKAQGLFTVSGDHGSKRYGLTVAGAEFFNGK